MDDPNLSHETTVQDHVNYLFSRFGPLDDTVLRSPTRADKALLRVDAEMNAMKQAILSLMPRRNALLPISRLPSEVLGLIFRQLTILDPPYREYIRQYKGSLMDPENPLRLGWISSVTHVCKTWRTMACQQPALWTTLSCALTERWREEFLIRSGNASIYLKFLPDRYPRLGSATLYRHLSSGRVAGLELEVILEDLKLRDYFSQPNTLLRRLHVSGPDHTTSISPECHLPSLLFSGYIPPLESVALSRWGCRWSAFAPFSRTLRSLHIVGTCYNGSTLLGNDFCEPWQDFVSCISNLLSLESLKLHQCLPKVPSEVHWQRLPCAPIALTRLREFDLYSDFRGAMTCTQLITLPAICIFRLRVTVNSVWDTAGFMELSLPLVTLFLEKMTAYAEEIAPIKRLRIQDHGLVRIDAYTKAQDLMDETRVYQNKDTSVPGFSLVFDAGIRQDASVNTLSSLLFFKRILHLNSLLFAGIEELDVDGSSKAWSTSSWIDIFGGFELLESIQLIGSGRATLTFPRAITAPRPENIPDPQKGRERWDASFLFPALKTVAFYEVNFYARTPRENRRPLWSAIYEDFYGSERTPPDNLVVERCSISESHFETFDIIMPTMSSVTTSTHAFRWDGVRDIPGVEPLLDTLMNDDWNADDLNDDSD